jgi:hypothetical protein
MAIIIEGRPYSATTVYNENWLTVFSLNAASNANFKYVFDLYLETSASTKVMRNQIPPYPVTGRGYYNPNKSLEKYLYYDLNPTQVSFASSTNSIVKYVINIGESFGNPLTGSTVYPNLSGFTGYTFNGVVPYEDLPYWSSIHLNYLLTGSTSKFLTSKPATSWIRPNEYETIGFFASGGTLPVNFMKVTVGSQSYYIENTGNSITTDAMIQTFGVGVPNINAVNAAQLYKFVGNVIVPSLVTQPIISGNSNYSIQAVNMLHLNFPSSDNEFPMSEIRYYNNDNRCRPYTPVRIAFLNSFGQFDYFSFNLVSRKNLSSNRKTFKKVLPPYYTLGARGTTVYDIEAGLKASVQSDYLNESEAQWLAYELTISKEVYEVRNDTQLIPIVITTDKQELLKQVNNGILFCAFEYEYANKVNTQRA